VPFNSYDRRHDPTCLPDTRVEIIREITDWADGQVERRIFWLNGMAGTGKSTIARTVARDFYEQKGLGASFFSPFFSNALNGLGQDKRYKRHLPIGEVIYRMH
jgi:hypothetical protein